MGWSGTSRFLERPGWAAQLRDEDREYVSEHGTEAKGDPVLSAALAWGATNGMLLRLRDSIPELVVVRYEDLAADPESPFPALAVDPGPRGESETVEPSTTCAGRHSTAPPSARARTS